MRNNKKVLLVEDDMVDALAVKRALREIGVKNELMTATNGEEGLEYLRENEDDLPCIILLDLNMPRMNGVEFLEEVKKEDRFRGIPVIVFTTSSEEQDRFQTFKLGVAGYMVKPIDHNQFVDVMRTIDQYWTKSELPG